jgi:phenylpropionate dioxygenase-like ring-hydroxylating dioxygenase large terminal subunit
MNGTEMFAGFAAVWSPIALSTSLGRAPLGLTVAGTPVALFRDGDGVAHALVDRCPHRAVKLSLGQVEDGCLRCPFHGWRFSGDGACQSVPWHNDAKRATMSAQPLSTRERGGFIWIFTGPAAAATGEPAPPDEVVADGVVLTGSEFSWSAHWTRAVENMVDDSHLPFVHPRTIGRGMQKKPTSTLTLDVAEHPWGYSWKAVIDGVTADWAAELRFPNVSLLRIPVPGRRLGICFAAVPVDETRVRILQLSYRDFLTSPLFHPVFRWINRRVLVEDQAVVESSPPGPVPAAAAEVSVATDVIGLRFRKRYFAELAPAPGRLGNSNRDPTGMPASTRGEGPPVLARWGADR